MLHTRWRLLLAICILANAVNAQSVSERKLLAARIDQSLKPYVDTDNFTGVVLVSRNGRVLFEKGYGWANVELKVANNPQMRFHVASITKTFTAAAILLLVERGKLKISDTVATLLPDYPNGAKLTIEHLLTHTSGIPNTGGLAGWSDEERKPHTLPELVGLFKDKPLEFEPGTRTSYSNSNYNLLALLIEKISGQSYTSFLQENIFGPLALRATLNNSDAAQLIPNRATGIEPDGVSGARYPRYIDWSSVLGSGSLVTTARDLDTFVTALFGRKFLTANSVALITRPAEGFAYGWLREERFGRKQIRAGGRSPGYNVSVERYLDDGTNVIVLSNSYSPVAQDFDFLNGLHSAVFGRPTTAPGIKPMQVRAGSLQQFAGQYRLPHDYFIPDAVITLSESGDHLDAYWSSGGKNTVIPIGENRFLDRNYWARLTFTHNPNGSISGFSYEVAGQKFVAVKLPNH